MRLEIIICLSIIIVIVVVAVYWIRIVSYGYWFCELTDDFFEIIRKIELAKNDEEKSNVQQTIISKYIRIIYDPNNFNSLFFELDYIIIKIQSYYELIEKKEKFFRLEDWNRIQSTKKNLQDKINRIKYEEWIHGYRKL